MKTTNKARLVSALVVFGGLLLSYNNCGDAHFSQGLDTITGNPLTPVSNEIMYAVCGVINRCNPQVTVDKCQQALLATSGFSTPLGLSPAYSTFASIVQGESTNALTGNPTAAAGCYDSINSLTCGDPTVSAAYNPSLADPFSNSPGMIPSVSCDQSFSSGVNLEAPVELTDYGLSSNTSATTFSRTRTSLNTADYDGSVTYSFEVVASNTDSSNRNISLVSSSGIAVAAITVPAGTADPTRLRTAFAPSAGTDNYRLRLDGTPAADQLSAYAGRILIKQVGATQTKIYVPLTDSYADAASHADDSSAAVDVAVYGGVYGQNTPYAFALWNKNEAAFSQLAAANAFTFEAVLSGTGPAYASLFDYTSGLQVTASEVSVNSSVPTLVSSSFSDPSANFTNSDDMEVRLKNSGAGTDAWIYRSGLWIKLVNLSHAEVYFRYSMRQWQNTPTGDNKYYWSPVLLDLSLFTAPTVFNEATGYSFASGTQCTGTVLDVGAADSAFTGTAVTGSALTFSTTQRVRLRTQALNATSGDRFIGDAIANPTTSTCTIPQSQLVVGF